MQFVGGNAQSGACGSYPDSFASGGGSANALVACTGEHHALNNVLAQGYVFDCDAIRQSCLGHEETFWCSV